MLNVLSVYLILDAVHGVNTGIVRALGKQFNASIVTIVCYYIIGMPLALVFGFTLEMGLVGFWLGFIIAMFLLDVVMTVVIATSDWEIGKKHDEPELRLTRQNSFISCGSESSNRKSTLSEAINRKTRQNSFVSHGSSSSKKVMLQNGIEMT